MTKERDGASDRHCWGEDRVLLEELAQRRPGPSPPQTEHEPAEPETYRRLNEAKFFALCLSGGGIRSASFCLGILQALARGNFLSRLDYLSTVSGGGYIGAWLSAWCHRLGCINQVEAALAGTKEPDEVKTLRDYTSYLTPRSGLLSSDTWAGIATVVRNLVLNWLLFLPLFLLLVWLPKACTFLLREVSGWLSANRLVTETSGLPVSPLVFVLSIACVVYGASALFANYQLALQQWPSLASGRKLFGAAQAMYSAVGLLPFCLAASLVTAMLIAVHYGSGSDGDLSPELLLRLAMLGAAAWGLPFLLVYFSVGLRLALRLGMTGLLARRSLRRGLEFAWQIIARFCAGAGCGVVLAVIFALLWRINPGGGIRYMAILGLPACLLAHGSGNTLFVGLTSRIRDHDGMREWLARAGGFFAVTALAWVVLTTLALWTPVTDWPGPFTAIQIEGGATKLLDELVAGVGGVSGIAAALFGNSRSTAANNGKPGGAQPRFDWTRVAQAGGLLFFAALIFELSRAFDVLTPYGDLVRWGADDIRFHGYVLAILTIWLLFASAFININKFSLHAFYRNRLIRAYLGASNKARRPSAFTGFDESDNVKMKDLMQCPAAPIQVINIALNLVRGATLAWQERKASSFTVTHHAVGNPHLGYRPCARYGDQITLGTAMAISGAAVSPNMGYHSSPVLGLLMTLLNLRLGWWLGNPARAAWKRAGPSWSMLPFLTELFGLTNDRKRFVYLSDGGHFENLGIYEMLRRRCRLIIAVDAGADADFKFEDLGNAIRKARIDFSIEIEFNPLRSVKQGSSEASPRLGLVNRPDRPATLPYCAVATITYPEPGCTGRLFYIKAAIHGDEPEDIGSYAAANPKFPHESTGDQFFTESQFESYRRLGLHIGLAVLQEQDIRSQVAV